MTAAALTFVAPSAWKALRAEAAGGVGVNASVATSVGELALDGAAGVEVRAAAGSLAAGAALWLQRSGGGALRRRGGRRRGAGAGVGLVRGGCARGALGAVQRDV